MSRSSVEDGSACRTFQDRKDTVTGRPVRKAILSPSGAMAHQQSFVVMQERAVVILLALLVAASLLCSAAAVLLRSRLPPQAGSGQETVTASGVVKRIDVANGALLVKHGAIASFGMPDMTMSFEVHDPQMLGERTEGEAITFRLAQRDGALVVVAITPSPRPVLSPP